MESLQCASTIKEVIVDMAVNVCSFISAKYVKIEFVENIIVEKDTLEHASFMQATVNVNGKTLVPMSTENQVMKSKLISLKKK